MYKLSHFLKLGDDQSPVQLTPRGENGAFQVIGDCVWAKAEDEITPDSLRSRVEPWLTALFQSEHLNLLVGAGLSTAIQQSATGQNPQGMGWIEDLKVCKSEIDAYVNKTAKASGRGKGNIEDQIRSINELIKGLEILVALNPAPLAPPPPPNPPYRYLPTELNQLREELTRCLQLFAQSVINGEKSIRDAKPELKIETFNYLVNFLMSFASRASTRDRLHIFTTNYDRILEIGAEIAGLRLVD